MHNCSSDIPLKYQFLNKSIEIYKNLYKKN